MGKTFSQDPSKKVIIPGDHEETLAFAAKHFVVCAQNAIKIHGRFVVALSGGSTPKAIYHKLAAEYHNALDWTKVFLFWSDERAVAPTHQDSNYRMSMESGFSKLPIPPSQIFRMKGESQLDKEALDYEKSIHALLGKDASFDLALLGVGEDGHTASLFPGTKGLEEKNHLVVANYIPQKDSWRLTLTLPCLHKAKLAVFYVLGYSKKDILTKIFLEHKSFPCCLVGSIQHPSLWILDTDASPF